MSRLTTCLISLGSNLPHEGRSNAQTVKLALDTILSESGGTVKVSRLYRNPAFPPGSGPDFVNAAALAKTRRSPKACLRWLHGIEVSLGRERGNGGRTGGHQRWKPRIIDLDLLDCDGQVLPDIVTWHNWSKLPLEDQMTMAPDELVLPHPRITDRVFVLVPLRDVAPTWRHPVTGRSIEDLLARLPGEAIEAMSVLDDEASVR